MGKLCPHEEVEAKMPAVGEAGIHRRMVPVGHKAQARWEAGSRRACSCWLLVRMVHERLRQAR
jgi:hypothetical protein